MIFTSDSSRLVFSADQNNDNVSELYSAPSDGSAPAIRLDPPVNGAVGKFIITDDSQYAIFSLDPTPATSESASLFVAVLDGSLPATPITPLLQPGQAITDFVYSDSLQSVIYGYDPVTTIIRNEIVARAEQIYAVPILGGTLTLISDPLVSGGFIERMQLGPDGRTIVYSAFQDSLVQKELYGIHLVPEPSSIVLAILGILICSRSNWHAAKYDPRQVV